MKARHFLDDRHWTTDRGHFWMWGIKVGTVGLFFSSTLDSEQL